MLQMADNPRNTLITITATVEEDISETKTTKNIFVKLIPNKLSYSLIKSDKHSVYI